MLVFKASGGKLGGENTQRQTQDAQHIYRNLDIGIEEAPPEAYEVPMRSTKCTRKMFAVACGTTQPATQPTQPQPNQPERESAEIQHRAHIGVMCSVNRKTLVSSKLLVGFAHHPPSHPTTPHPQPSQQERERQARNYDTGRIWWSCARSTAKLGTLQIAHLPMLSQPNPSCRQPMPPKQNTETC